MKFTDNQFQLVVLFSLIFAIAIVWIVFSILKKKGYDIFSQRLQFKVIFSAVPIVLIPFWINGQVSLKTAICCTLVGLAIGLLNFLTWEKRGDYLRQQLGIKHKTNDEKQEK